MGNVVRVLIADDHTIVREGLQLLLSRDPEIEVVAEASSGREAVRLATEHHPDVVIMDISMPDLDGLEAIRIIRAQCPHTQVLILSVHGSESYFFRALQAGVSGYILKSTTAEELIRAVHAVAQGDAFLYPPMARKLIEEFRRQEGPRGDSGYASLTNREREILLLLAQGLTNREIGERLVISPSTVQAHRTHIMEKLGLSSRADLIRYAIRHGLVEL